jgi:segregation and condensation protein A
LNWIERLNFKIDTSQFRGPIDLLLFLVRRNEVELGSIGLAEITNQYLQFLEVLKEIDIDSVGDFVDIASQLLEIKTRWALPHPAGDEDFAEIDPRQDLVQRLLMYKQYKDASILLEEQAADWQKRYSRISADPIVRASEFSEQPIEEVELWDLVSAFGRVLRDNLPKPEESIVYDETPIQVYMLRIHERLVTESTILFSTLFEPGMHKSAMVGIFLAVLELARHHNVTTKQTDLHGEIEIGPGDEFNKIPQFLEVS